MNLEHTAYLSLGSNLGNRYLLLQQALLKLQDDRLKVTDASAIYENKAVGFDGADFLNACIAIQTTYNPLLLLQRIRTTEQELGRERSEISGYTSRTVDLDILYFDDMVVTMDELTIPHPRMTERNFVLKPLADIAPQYYHPVDHIDTRNLLQQCRDKSSLRKTGHILYPNRQALFGQLQFLAIEGNIGAGKSTLVNMIAKDFNAKMVLERFADNPFLPKFYDDQARYAFPLEMSFLADRYQQFTDDTSQFDLFKNFMISDYDIFKSLIFAKITLQKEEFALYKKVFNFMYNEVKKPDIYVYLYQNTTRLLANIKKRGRDYEKNISGNYLDKINRGYLDFIKINPLQNSLAIDLTNLDFVANTRDYEHILGLIETRLIEILSEGN